MEWKKKKPKNNSEIHILRNETFTAESWGSSAQLLECTGGSVVPVTPSCGDSVPVQWHLPFSCTARAKAEPPQKERTEDVLSCWTAADQAPNVFLWKETESNRVSLTALKMFSSDKTKSQHKQMLARTVNRNFCVNTEEGTDWLKHDTASLCGFEQVASLIPQSDPCLPVPLPRGEHCSSIRVSWEPLPKPRVQVCKAFWQWRLLCKNTIRLFTVD